MRKTLPKIRLPANPLPFDFLLQGNLTKVRFCKAEEAHTPRAPAAQRPFDDRLQSRA
jgi:hypothetical protein